MKTVCATTALVVLLSGCSVEITPPAVPAVLTEAEQAQVAQQVEQIQSSIENVVTSSAGEISAATLEQLRASVNATAEAANAANTAASEQIRASIDAAALAANEAITASVNIANGVSVSVGAPPGSSAEK